MRKRDCNLNRADNYRIYFLLTCKARNAHEPQYQSEFIMTLSPTSLHRPDWHLVAERVCALARPDLLLRHA